MAKLSPPTRLALRIDGAVLLAGFLAFVLYTATPIGGEALFGTWIYCAVMLGAAASCLARAALVRRERAAWALIGVGLLIWTGGEIYYEAALSVSGSVPIPSPADAGYLLFYPLTYAGLIVLLRERIGSFPFTRWLDGLIAGLAVAALTAALALGPIADASTGGSSLEVATNLAYPISDLTLLALVVSAAAFTGWRPGRDLVAARRGPARPRRLRHRLPARSPPRAPTSKAASSTPPGRSAPCSSRAPPGCRRGRAAQVHPARAAGRGRPGRSRRCWRSASSPANGSNACRPPPKSWPWSPCCW